MAVQKRFDPHFTTKSTSACLSSSDKSPLRPQLAYFSVGNSSFFLSSSYRLTAYSKAFWPGRFPLTVLIFLLMSDHGFLHSFRKCQAFADSKGDRPFGCTAMVYFIARWPRERGVEE